MISNVGSPIDCHFSAARSLSLICVTAVKVWRGTVIDWMRRAWIAPYRPERNLPDAYLDAPWTRDLLGDHVDERITQRATRDRMHREN